MTERSLEVTYRKGKAFAAYLHLSHETGERSAKTVPAADGLPTAGTGRTALVSISPPITPCTSRYIPNLAMNLQRGAATGAALLRASAALATPPRTRGRVTLAKLNR